jgi:hypothetical protein
MAPFGGDLKERMFVNLTATLALSVEQQEKIRAIYDRIFPETTPGYSKRKRSQDDWRKRVDTMNAEIKQALTPEQQKKFDAAFAPRPAK